MFEKKDYSLLAIKLIEKIPDTRNKKIHGPKLVVDQYALVYQCLVRKRGKVKHELRVQIHKLRVQIHELED